jgi:hypothetical protein
VQLHGVTAVNVGVENEETLAENESVVLADILVVEALLVVQPVI